MAGQHTIHGGHDHDLRQTVLPLTPDMSCEHDSPEMEATLGAARPRPSARQTIRGWEDR